jgi:signal transduction histidine kinase
MNANVLVIDDELTVCSSCRKILNEDGYNVSMTLSGREGLERARKEDFDLVIVDLKMPDIDGMEVVEAIKRERPGMAVIIMTGYSTVPSAVKGMKLGAADYVPKPFTPDEMSAAVRRALQQNEQKAETEDAGLLINRETIIEVLTRAAEDKEFAARLSDVGSDMLEEYDLSPEEKAALVSVIQPSEEEAMLVVSHELKSPLASIANLARAIQEPNVAGDRKERFLTRIVSRAESALAMIEDYLTLSKISAGELEIAPKKVNIYKEVIESALDDQGEAMAEKGMSADIEVPEELEVACDPEFIKIVYSNLISNATKYGDPHTEIHLGYSGMRDGYHYFNVANAGEWIKEADRKRIFEKYVTLGKRGTGIGLHAAREIIRKHGGDIWVEPCYFARGTFIPAKSVIEETTVTEKSPGRLIEGNNFVFRISAGNEESI